MGTDCYHYLFWTSVGIVITMSACGANQGSSESLRPLTSARSSLEFERTTQQPNQPVRLDAAYMVAYGMPRVAEPSNVGGPTYETASDVGVMLGRLCALFGKPEAEADGFSYFVRHGQTGVVFLVTTSSSWGIGYHAYWSDVAEGGKQEPSNRLRVILEQFERELATTTPVECEATLDDEQSGSGRFGYRDGHGFSRELDVGEVLAHRMRFAQGIAIDASLLASFDAFRLWAGPFGVWNTARNRNERIEIQAQLRQYWQRRFTEVMDYASLEGHEAELVHIMACALLSVGVDSDLLSEATQRTRLEPFAIGCDD